MNALGRSPVMLIAARTTMTIGAIDRIVRWLDGWEERRRRAASLHDLKRPSRPQLASLPKSQVGSA